MSFGTSAGDAILLVQLAWKTVQGARQACGEHDELTREATQVVSLHKVLLRLQREYEDPDSLLARADDDRRQEMGELCSGCEEVLKVMDQIISKYNALSEEKRSGKRLWQKIRFGNGEMQDLAEIRLKLSAHTSAILLSVNLCSLGSQGRVEKRLSDAGGDLEGIRSKVNWIAANMSARSGDGSVWSSYTNDDKGFWRELRRGLVQEGYRSSVLHRHKHLIKQYVEELGNRGVFDETHDAEPSDDLKGEDDSSSADVSDSEKEREDLQSENIETGAQSSGLENRDDKRPGKEVSSKDPLSALDYPGNLKPESAPMGDDGETIISSPEDTEVLGSSLFPPKSPKSPKGPKYLRFDKQIHIGSINPQARRARTAEEQEAHDNRKGARKSRTPEQQMAHENRKKERKVKRKTSIVHGVTEIEFEQLTTSESSLGKHVQLEQITDEEFLPNDRDDEILNESGRGPDVQTEFMHSKTDSQGLSSDSTNIEPSEDSTIDVSQLAEGLATESYVKLQTEYEVPSQAENVNAVDTFKSPVPLPPKCGVIRLKDAVAREFTFPIHRVKTWKEFKNTIDIVFQHVEAIGYHVREERYDIVGPNGDIILPQIWEDLIQPGWSITMHMWPRPLALEALKQHPPLARFDFDKEDETFESDNQVINFKDAVGRKFSFPYYKVRTWKGIQALINQAFIFVEVIGPHVKDGHYDLVGPDGTIIIPEFWKDLIQPDWNISMLMWPIPEAPRPNHHVGKPPLSNNQRPDTPGTGHSRQQDLSSVTQGVGRRSRHLPFPPRGLPHPGWPISGAGNILDRPKASQPPGHWAYDYDAQGKLIPGTRRRLGPPPSRSISHAASSNPVDIDEDGSSPEKAKKKRPRAKPPGVLAWMSGRERPQVTKTQKAGNP